MYDKNAGASNPGTNIIGQPGQNSAPNQFPGKAEIELCRERLVGRGLFFAAGAIVFTCIAAFVGLSVIAGPEGLSHPSSGQAAEVMTLCGLAGFAILAAVVVPLSKKAFGPVETVLLASAPVREPEYSETIAVRRVNGSATIEERQPNGRVSYDDHSDPGMERAPRQSAEAPQRAINDQQLKATSALLRSIIDSLPHCVFCKESDGTYSFANTAFSKRLGTPVEKIMGAIDFPSLPFELRDRT
ncbi:MAG TPA: hypothetical protein VI756_32030, partial [Blastocatellia bacterium]